MGEQSKSELVYHQLRERILSGRYTPGYRLILASIAREFDVSPVPVREAIRILEAEGLVEYTLNVGAQVTAIDLRSYRESMAILGVLEGAATALSAPRLDAEKLEEARELNERMRALTVSDAFESDAYRRLNGYFHNILISACPNQRLLALLQAEAERVNVIRRTTIRFSPEHSKKSVTQHTQLLGMIDAGAPGNEIESYVRFHKNDSLVNSLSAATPQILR